MTTTMRAAITTTIRVVFFKKKNEARNTEPYTVFLNSGGSAFCVLLARDDALYHHNSEIPLGIEE